MPTHISQKMGLHINSHSEIEFVDIVLSPDKKLFLDPCLIEMGKDSWSIQAQGSISSYFDCFYGLYRQGASMKSKLDMFEHAHEINATKLGYGSGHNGKAKTAEGMIITFTPIESLLNSGINMQYANDLPIFIRNFAEDCLSDMLTNILFKVLSDFTLEQCRKKGIETKSITEKCYYWDIETSSWQLYRGECLIVDGDIILLVPKHFVRQRYYFNTTQFFSRVILGKIQEDESWVDSSGKKQKPSKKDLRNKYKGDSSTLDCSIEFTRKNPSYLLNYHQILPSLYSVQAMSDEKLDKIVYGIR